MEDDTSPSPWLDWQNAAIYQSFVTEYPIYEWLNRRLAAIAPLRSARRVLDLACGTGATARQVTALMDRDAELIGVDIAPPMVEIARAEIQDPRCRFIVADARELRHRLDGYFDAVICNAAFWQLPDSRRVLEQVARVLRPGGQFAFSIPSQQLMPESAGVHPFQVALSRQLYGWQTPNQTMAAHTPPAFSLEMLKGLLEVEGYILQVHQEAVYAGFQEEFVHLMQIPAMASSVAPDLPVSHCHQAIAMALRTIEPLQEVQVPWTFLCAQLTSRT